METPIVEYASPAANARRREYVLFRTACACALIPMAAGLLVTAAWLVTMWPLWESAGFVVLIAGFALSIAGGICCFADVAESTIARRPWKTWLPRVALAACLLLANFPIAYGCAAVARLSRLRVVNASKGPVTSLVVTDPGGATWQLGPIAPGGSAWRMMWFDGEGAVTYAATTTLPGGAAVTGGGTLDSYITGVTGGSRYVITVRPDGTCTPPP